MKIGIITGSHRRDSQSAKVGRFLSAQLNAKDGVTSWMLDLGKTPLPLWDEDLWNQGPQWSGIPDLKATLDGCDGFVFVAPEWHGMVPAALKNFSCCGLPPGAFHKPALPCAVSAGDGGAYVISELRMSSYKTTGCAGYPSN